MSAVTHDVIPEKKRGRKKRRKGMAALKALRAAIARRQVEVRQEDIWLQEQLFDVFADEQPARKR
jgi:endonuclease YncB( thermonuclease family)